MARRLHAARPIGPGHGVALGAVAVLVFVASFTSGPALGEPPAPAPAEAAATAVPPPAELARTVPSADAAPTAAPPGGDLPSRPQPDRSAGAAAPTPRPAPAPAGPAARWVQNARLTGLYSGPDTSAVHFTDLPLGSYLRVLEVRPDWLLVHYAGDGAARQPGPGWVASADVLPAEPPSLWLKNHRETTLWAGPEGTATQTGRIRQWSLFEALGPGQNGRLPVRFPGNGEVPPGRGWVDERDVGQAAPPARSQLPQGYPFTADGAALRVHVPYRSQLDGSDSQSANCGPASAGMLLSAYGVEVPTLELRQQMLRLMGVWGNETGVYIETIAQVLERYGVRTADLWTGGPVRSYRRWALDDARAHLRAGHPVVVQVRYRLLPGREDYPDADDHYVILTGLLGDSFLYNDPIDKEGPGFDRVITAEQLQNAWYRSSEPRAAFAVLGKR